jgi:hypothetical protein
VSFAAITLCVASERVFIVVVCFVIDSVRNLLVTPSYIPGVSTKMLQLVNVKTVKSTSTGVGEESVMWRISYVM